MGGSNVSLGSIRAGLALSGEVDLNIDTITLNGGLDLGLDDIKAELTLTEVTTNSQLHTNLRVEEIKTNSQLSARLALEELTTNSQLNATLKTDSALSATLKTDSALDAAVRTDSKVDLGLDDIRIRELPPLDLRFAIRPFRLHLPLNFKFCVKMLGVTLLEFSACGESMAISEDYEPRGTERCG